MPSLNTYFWARAYLQIIALFEKPLPGEMFFLPERTP
jgi:hypothetical protein